MKLKLLQNSFPRLLIVLASISIIAAALYYSQIDLPLQERYATIAKEMRQKTQTLIDEKKETIFLIALSMSNDSHIREAIISNQVSRLKLNNLAGIFEQHTSLKNLWFQIIKKNGDSFYRSWTEKRGDKISLARLDIAAMLENHNITNSISTGKFDLTFKAMVPIYDDQEFIGIFEVIAKFNSIADKLKNEGINSVFLVDKSYKKQLTKAFSKTFVQDYYVTNPDVNKKYLNILQANKIEDYIEPENNFQLDKANDLLVAYFSLSDIKNNPMGHFILFKSLDAIDVDDIYSSRNQFLLTIAFLVIFLFVIIRYISNRHLTQKIKEINIRLEEKVSLKNKELIEQGIFLKGIMNGVSNSVIVIDKNYNVTMMNKVAQEIAGRNVTIHDKVKCYNMSHQLDEPCYSKTYNCPHHDVFASGKTSRVVHDHISAEGKIQFIEITATPMFNEAGEVKAIIELGHDITDHILLHEQLQQQKTHLAYQAQHDALTDLPNRALFVDRAAQNIKLAKRENIKVAILFMDLDHFKEINDTLGHSAGDKVLIEIARRLKNNIRNIDTVARLGGDEFTLVLANIKQASKVIEIAQKLIDALAIKITYGKNDLYVTASIGISLYPDDGEATEILLRNADSAMYQAKEHGRNNYQFYTQEMTKKFRQRKTK